MMTEEFNKRFNSLVSIGFSVDHADREPTNDEIREGVLRRIHMLSDKSTEDNFIFAIQDTLHDTIEQDIDD